ncbi:HYR domain-containing protein [Haliscomenobacter hydrossis]|uniref:Cohesin domain protein n=1 Tax=Haliscomenobacter hydrossis (strain ATCC 27775 / DSM 1100 / LMG 10767 / O) TaxID=760192 RepID=F4KTX3_HALH1|nr:HYR domain-containing protein [Haliscomenobacter hydrossis]AEE49109.1 cohesin domain protein [Haliscomenobacter hydrossis DSM 1100]
MRKILFILLSSMLCWQLSALDGPKNHVPIPSGYLSFFMPLYDSTAFPICIAGVKGRLTDTLVCVEVVASNFDTIAALQYSVQFDTSIIKLKSIKLDTVLKGLSLTDFGTTPVGRISLVYARADSTGLTLADKTRLYQLCFSPVKAGRSELTFVDTLEVLGPKGAKKEFKGEPGWVEITTCSDTTVFKTQIICEGTPGIDTFKLTRANGCDSTVIVTDVLRTGSRDTLIYTTICEGQTYVVGENVFRQAGTYIVNLITPGGCDSTVQLALAVKPMLGVTITGGDSSICDGDSTLVTISGGDGYIWSTGATTDSVWLGPGTYTVSVKDTTGGCEGTRTVVIGSASPKPQIESDTIRACSVTELPTITVKADSTYTVNWYNVPTGGTPLATDTLSFKPSTADTFYVEAIDSSGSNCASTERTAIVVLIDSTQTAGFTVCPTDITTVAPAGQTTAVVTWTVPTFTSGCDSTVAVLSSNYEPGDTLAVGTTSIRYVLTDTSANKVIDSCIFKVILGTDSIANPIPVDSLTFYVDTSGVTLTDSTMNVPVKVLNFDGVQGFQFSLSIPDSLATFVGFISDTTALKGVENFAFSSTVRTVNWFDAQSNGVTLADSTTIFTLQISRDSASKECIPVQFKNAPSKIIATKSSLTEIIPTTIDGVVCPDTTTIPPIDTTGPIKIAGKIYREDSTPVKFVTVDISPDSLASVITGVTGEYSFDSLVYNRNHTIRPSLDSNYSGGVNILDVVLIQRHILAKDTLDSPYKWIAADVNRSGSVTVGDILDIRRLILGALDSFSNNTSWRFVPASFEFPDSVANPLSVPFPDSISFTGLKKDTLNNDFIGIKVGDVNLSRDAQLRTEEPMEIMMVNRAFDYGEKLVVDVRASDVAKYAGYQFDLGFDRETLEFVGVEAGDVPGVDRNSFNLDALAEGRIPTLWYQTGAALRSAENPILFKLTFNTRRAGEVAGTIWLNQQGLAGMAVNQAGRAQVIKARYTDAALKVDLGNRKAIKALGVQPNPFSDQALIRFKLPTDSRTTLSIIDAAGREVYREARNLSAGVQEWTIDGNTLGQNGVYHYRILTAYGVLTDKVILTK